MTTTNATVADFLRRYAVALSLEGANRFKIKAYRRAAETIEGLDESVADRVKQGSDLKELPGIGNAISDIIVEIVHSGRLPRLERTIKRLAPELVELATRPALDPKKVARVYKKLGISSLKELQRSLEAGRIGKLLGPRWSITSARVSTTAPAVSSGASKTVLTQSSDSLRLPARRNEGRCHRQSAAQAGHRRRPEFPRHRQKRRSNLQEIHLRRRTVLGTAECQRSVCSSLSSGLTVVLRWTPPEEWGLSLLLATGSPPHIAELQARRTRRTIRFTPAGLAQKHIDLANEESIYAGLGLAFIEPELREGRGEVIAAARGTLPTLVELGDLRGDLHMHTTASDGANSIAEMAAAAQERGYEYIAITDHSQSLKITNGLSEERLLEQIRTIDKLNAKLKGFRILKSAEVDILEDGKLDYSQCDAERAGFHDLLDSLPIRPQSRAADGAHSAGDGQPVLHHPRPRDGAAAC